MHCAHNSWRKLCGWYMALAQTFFFVVMFDHLDVARYQSLWYTRKIQNAHWLLQISNILVTPHNLALLRHKWRSMTILNSLDFSHILLQLMRTPWSYNCIIFASNVTLTFRLTVLLTSCFTQNKAGKRLIRTVRSKLTSLTRLQCSAHKNEQGQ